jgi:hypothetical protein
VPATIVRAALSPEEVAPAAGPPSLEPPPAPRSIERPALVEASPAPAAPPPTRVIAAEDAAAETLVYLKALAELLVERGFFTAEEIADALKRARGE